MPAPDQVTIQINTNPALSVTPHPGVGSVYQVGINGVGYMLADHPEKNLQYKRGTTSLLPERLATSETPFAQAIDRYSFGAQSVFDGGAGQRWAKRERSDPTLYWRSKGVDPFTNEGGVCLLPSMSRILAETYADIRLVTVGDYLFHTSAADAVTWTTNGTGYTDITGLTDTTGAIPGILGFTSDGGSWYAATGRSVIKGLLSNPGTDWSAQDATDVAWAAGRICAAVKGAGSSTGNIFTTLAPDGTEERAGGHMTFPTGHTVILGGSAQGYFFFGSSAGDNGAVHAWELGVDDAGTLHVPFTAWDLPNGLTPTAVHVGGGNVWVRAHQTSGAGAGRTFIYQCIVGQSGGLTPFLICEIEPEDTGSYDGTGRFASHGDHVYFTWPEVDGVNGGTGTVYLPTGGWAKWVATTDPDEPVDIVVWQGRVVVASSGDGIWAEDLTAKVTSGTIDLGLVDGASDLQKVFDELSITVDPIVAGQTVEALYTADQGSSYTSLGTLSTAGALSAHWDLGLRVAALGMRLILGGDGTSTPCVTFAQVKFHPLGLSDQILILPIECSDNVTGLNGRPLPESTAGAGFRRARTLHGLAQQRVLVQDIDYPVVGLGEVYEVIDTETVLTELTMDSQQGRQVARMVVQLVMRKGGA